MSFDEEFPENSAFAVSFDSTVARDAAEECASIIHMESKLPVEKRHLTPGLREAIRKMHRADCDRRMRQHYG